MINSLSSWKKVKVQKTVREKKRLEAAIARTFNLHTVQNDVNVKTGQFSVSSCVEKGAAFRKYQIRIIIYFQAVRFSKVQETEQKYRTVEICEISTVR